MSDTVQTIRNIILQLVPADGSTIGNQALLTALRDHMPDENGGEKVGHGSGGMSPLRAA